MSGTGTIYIVKTMHPYVEHDLFYFFTQHIPGYGEGCGSKEWASVWFPKGSLIFPELLHL